VVLAAKGCKFWRFAVTYRQTATYRAVVVLDNEEVQIRYEYPKQEIPGVLGT
jgi:hypothetical protein